MWHTDKTEEILNLFEDIFKMDPYYSQIKEEIEDYSKDSLYPLIGYEKGDCDPVNINNDGYFKGVDSKYIPPEKLLELFNVSSILKYFKLSHEPILEFAVTYEAQSEQSVESTISQITETREQPKSFFNF